MEGRVWIVTVVLTIFVLVSGSPLVAGNSGDDGLTENESVGLSVGADVSVAVDNLSVAAADVSVTTNDTALTATSSVDDLASTDVGDEAGEVKTLAETVTRGTNGTTDVVTGDVVSDGDDDRTTSGVYLTTGLLESLSVVVEGSVTAARSSPAGVDCRGCETEVPVGTPAVSSSTASTPSLSTPTPSLSTPTPEPSTEGEECSGCGTNESAGAPLAGLAGSVLGLARRPASGVDSYVNLATALAPLASSSRPGVQLTFERAVRQAGRMPVFPFYSRSDDSDPLEHEDRRALARLVRDHPGLPLADVSDQLGVPRSTLRYHARILEEEDRLASRTVLGRRRLFPARMDRPPALTAALQDSGTRQVLRALSRHEPATVSTLADELGKATSTVSYHLGRLDEADVITRERDVNRVVNRLRPTARTALTTVADADD